VCVCVEGGVEGAKPATGQVDVITAAAREGVLEQVAAGGDMQRGGWFVWIDAVNVTPRVHCEDEPQCKRFVTSVTKTGPHPAF
jgi:hypothetical protein